MSVAPGDFLVVGTLVVLEGLLSADNALVLALLVKHLPHREQKKALLYGLIGAFLLRGIAIFFAKYLMNLWWMCAIGAVYLIALAGRHFFLHSRSDEDNLKKKANGMGFWPTVVQVELTDIIFAIDSILVAVALVHNPSKIWIVYAGGFLGILLLRLAAGFFIKLITKFPGLDHLAYALVAWAGVKLSSSSADIYYEALGQPEPHFLPTWAFWVGFAVITVVGALFAVKEKRDSRKFVPPPGPRAAG